jgi:protease-4
MGFSIYTLNAFKNTENSGLSFVPKGDEIAVVEVSGVIFESKEIVEKLRIAEKSKKIKAIIVRVDSPGGAVGPSQEIYEEIRRIDQDEEKGKPVYASFGSLAASGGYYIGAATRKIYTNAGTLTGSIGVIMQFVDFSKLLKWAKVDSNVIKAGKYKDIGQPNRPMTKEERKLLKKMLTGVHEQFVRDIMILRKGKIKGDIWKYAQGQVFTGEEAKKIGLVDELAGLWEAGRRIHKDLELAGEVNLKFIKKKKKISFFDILDSLDESLSHVKAGQIIKSIPMYLY